MALDYYDNFDNIIRTVPKNHINDPSDFEDYEKYAILNGVTTNNINFTSVAHNDNADCKRVARYKGESDNLFFEKEYNAASDVAWKAQVDVIKADIPKI